MPKAIQLNIPQPCHENWNAMSPKEQGRYCGSCQKTVVDFSVMTDKEIVDYFSKATHNVCGRFSGTQLNKDLPLIKKKKRFSFAYLWNFLLATFLVTETNAQVKPPKKTITVKQDPRPATLMGKPAMLVGDTVIAELPDLAPPKDITGTVTEEGTGWPMPWVTVMIKGTDKVTHTDSSGNFHLSVENKNHVIITFSNVGHITQTRLLNDQTNWEDMKVALPEIESEHFILGGVVSGYQIAKREKIKNTVSNRLPLTKKNIKIYPNPVARGNDIHISLSLKQSGNYKLELLDVDGRVVAVQPLLLTGKDQQENIPTELSWSKGIYWIRISAPKSKDIYQGKVLLQ